MIYAHCDREQIKLFYKLELATNSRLFDIEDFVSKRLDSAKILSK